jgi:hypothetical protein
VAQFLKRGDNRQKYEMKCCLKYWKVANPEFFEQINGIKIFKQLKDVIYIENTTEVQQ